MTSPHSSISNSEARRYLRVLTIALGVLVGILLTLTITGYSLGLIDAANREILAYQKGKIEKLAQIDIAFIGDSSLGNAIDATLFGQLSGIATANLALNGSYGSGGAYNMVRAVVARHRPQLVVVMLSLDSMRRADAFPGFFFSADTAQRFAQSPLRILELYFNLKAARRTLNEIGKGGLRRREDPIDDDYISQRGHPLERSPVEIATRNPLTPGMIAPAQLAYIGQIAAMCREHDIVCVYAHGPIFADYCLRSAPYLLELNAQIRAAGLEVVPGTPICMPLDEVGNSIDHVRPDLKQAYTRRYFDQLQRFIPAQ